MLLRSGNLPPSATDRDGTESAGRLPNGTQTKGHSRSLLSLVMLLVALAATGCGGSLGTTTTSPAGSTTTSSVSGSSGERQAAQAYFAAMAPTIDKDYRGMKGLSKP